MGLLRFILAAAVICGHSTRIFNVPILDAGLAVRAFFVISGFYMALILDSKYERKTHSLWLFYSNRFLRIYPMYYVTLLFSLLIYVAAAVKLGKPVDRLLYWHQAAHLGLWGPLILLALAQLLIFGIELSSLADFNPQTGFGLEGSMPSPATIPGWRFSFLPQTWTIGIELTFYALVPFLVHIRRRYLAGIIILHFVVLIILRHYWTSTRGDTILTHGFPFELGYFVMGILAYRLFYKRAIPGLGSRMFNWVVVAAILVASFALGLLKSPPSLSVFSLSYLGLLFLGVCFLFHQTKKSAIDRYIGELSYPMYLAHVPLRWVIAAVAGASHRGDMQIHGVVLLPVTVAFSALMLVFVDYPVDRWRQRRVGASNAQALPHDGFNPKPAS
jgi:peptidoglycan/LPS O-acetylase OafA/YrhL